jgi:hypothetical protein
MCTFSPSCTFCARHLMWSKLYHCHQSDNIINFRECLQVPFVGLFNGKDNCVTHIIHSLWSDMVWPRITKSSFVIVDALIKCLYCFFWMVTRIASFLFMSEWVSIQISKPHPFLQRQIIWEIAKIIISYTCSTKKIKSFYYSLKCKRLENRIKCLK